MQIVHNVAACRFETEVEGEECVCAYRLDAHEHEVTFTHTYVGESLRGRGIAAALAEAGLAWAQKEKLAVVPACSYIRGYLQRHPHWASLLAKPTP